ncbi:MAG: 6,7-dimethyl-8-ribityllumazine synthase [Planctomycetota bacterium]|jgi:6,7-dimethyl-8-ribityllumazine synthase|nr:6,7-dimethyl-8-ribityllumazine synthase [Planctomycetota bacterium]MDP6505906.1 6,7-dimethyl-8-ribityllumazine synthase [Planctomycetota bacterium]
MANIIEGELSGKDKKFAIVVSRFNEFITGKLLDSAETIFLKHEVAADDIDIVWVPGSFEIPVVAKKMAAGGKYAAVVCLGAVIRGQTSHFDFVAGESAKGIGNVALETGVPIIFGVITTENLEQAIDRAGARLGNRGGEAALTAIEMANLLDKLP